MAQQRAQKTETDPQTEKAERALAEAQSALAHATNRHVAATERLDAANQALRDLQFKRQHIGELETATLNRDGAAALVAAANGKIAAARRAVLLAETRRTVAKLGTEAPSLHAADEKLAVAEARYRKVVEARDAARQAHVEANEKRRQSVLAAASGDVAAAKALKAATQARSDAEDQLEIGEIAVQQASDDVSHCTNLRNLELVRALNAAAGRHGEKRIQSAKRIEILIGEALALHEEFNREGEAAERLLYEATRIGGPLPPAITAATNFARDRQRQRASDGAFLQVLFEKLPSRLSAMLKTENFTPRPDRNSYAEEEGAVWVQLEAAQREAASAMAAR